MNPIEFLFDTSSFPPRWHCGEWTDLHGWVHIISDTLIFAAYFWIPVAILLLIRKRPDLPFPRVFWLFGAFILLCGFGHLVEASLFWRPWYHFSALIKAATAVVSLATAVALMPVLREVIKIPGIARLNEELRREIAGRKKTEEALRASEERLRLITDLVPHGIFAKDAVGRYIFANRALADSCGLSVAEVLGKTDLDLVADKAQAEVYRADDLAVIQSGKAHFIHEEPYTDRSGRTRFLQTTKVPFTVPETGERAVLGAWVDVTERKRLEDRFRLVVESAPNAILMVDTSGLIVLANAQAERLFGYSREELMKQRIDNLMPDRFREKHPGFREGYNANPQVRAMGVGRDLFALNKDGAEVPVEIGLTPISAQDGQFVLASIIDISERRRAEDAIRASLREKEVLLKEVHHRVKNNLQIVSSLLNLQANRVTHPEAVAALSESRNRIRTMALVHEKLYQAEQLGVLDLAEYTRVLANELFSLYANATSGAVMHFQLTSLMLGIETAIPCSLIVNELLSNVFKYAFPEGRTGIAAVELVREGDNIRFSVRDNGVGFPAGFVIASSNSMGLQLVQDLARQLGGTFTVESEPGRTHCCVTFPAERANCFPTPP